MNPATSSDPVIGFIGAGNMASSLAGGLIAQGYPASAIQMSDVAEATLHNVQQRLGVTINSDNQAIVGAADIIVLAVKPQVMKSVLQPLAEIVQKRRPLIISIAAGIPVASMERWLGRDTAIVRCMPNTPALVQTGASGLYANAQVSTQQRAQAQQILSAVGIALWVGEERLIDSVTAVSGSGPAYFFLLMEAMTAAAGKLGLDADTARQLTLQTALGAARMAMDSDAGPEELRRRVTSPGGTTERAIATFEQAGLHNIVDTAINAACERSIELAEQLGKD